MAMTMTTTTPSTPTLNPHLHLDSLQVVEFVSELDRGTKGWTGVRFLLSLLLNKDDKVRVRVRVRVRV